MLVEDLKAGKFELTLGLPQRFFYALERRIGDRFFRQHPPAAAGRLLNLGAGPLIYDGWVNADDYAFKRGLREKAFRPQWRLDITRPWKCADNYWDGIFTQHVLEHLSYSEAVFVLEEALRTLRPGCWIRICLPDARKYVDHYRAPNGDGYFAQFHHGALALSFLTQMHLHRSTWDADILAAVLGEIGFGDVREVRFGEGSDARIIKDQEIKLPESFYMEARKP
jgi:hypothetical protein